MKIKENVAWLSSLNDLYDILKYLAFGYAWGKSYVICFSIILFELSEIGVGLVNILKLSSYIAIATQFDISEPVAFTWIDNFIIDLSVKFIGKYGNVRSLFILLVLNNLP